MEKTREMPRPKVTDKPSVRKEGVLDIFNVVLIPLGAMAAIETAKEPEDVSVYALDMMAIEVHKEPIADAVVELANTYPVLGAVLDKIAVATPFSALIASVMTLGLQIAENHRLLPDHAQKAFSGIGVVPREEIEGSLRKRGEEIRSNGA